MPEVTFVGTGEAFDPDLPNTSLLYRGSLTMLVDCGYRIPHALWALSTDANLLDAIYVSHLHADHSFGLPALLLWMREEGRTRPLTVVGGPGVGKWLDRLLELGYPGSYEKSFPIEPVELSPGATLTLGACSLSNAPSHHSVRNLALRIDEEPASVCYSGDGAPTDATRALFRGASLLVHECYALSAAPENHAAFERVVPMAAELDVKQLSLVHLGRKHKAAIRARAASQGVHLPAPGDTVQV